MTATWHRSVVGRRWFVISVALALLVQILVPQGFMLAPDAAGASVLYICSGHGPIAAPLDHGKPAKAPGSNGAVPCGFAHGISTPPPSAVSTAATFPFAPTVFVVRVFAAMPGLGLAAPPPPSQAPPLV
jgi:hypothetical protein